MRYSVFRMFLALVLAAQAAQPAATAGASAPGPSIFTDPRLGEALGPIDPRPGAWVEYAVVPRRGPHLRIRAAIVGTAPEGRYWLETVAQSGDGPPVATRLLVHGQPSRLRDVERAFLYVGGQAPIELPVADAQTRATKPLTGLPRLARDRPQVVRTTAGQFRTEVWRVQGTTIFRTPEVPLWGMVRARSSDRQVDLIAYAREGAESVFPPGWGDDLQGKGNESVK